MAYYGIIRDIDNRLQNIRVTWELMKDGETEGVSSTFYFEAPLRGTRAEFRDELVEHCIGVIRPIVERADMAEQHMAAIKSQLVGRRWPSP